MRLDRRFFAVLVGTKMRWPSAPCGGLSEGTSSRRRVPLKGILFGCILSCGPTAQTPMQPSSPNRIVESCSFIDTFLCRPRCGTASLNQLTHAFYLVHKDTKFNSASLTKRRCRVKLTPTSIGRSTFLIPSFNKEFTTVFKANVKIWKIMVDNAIHLVRYIERLVFHINY